MTSVCITGMNRSGTSIVARMPNLCSVYLGDEMDIMPPALDNQEGFWLLDLYKETKSLTNMKGNHNL
jgi:hypothetical protein